MAYVAEAWAVAAGRGMGSVCQQRQKVLRETSPWVYSLCIRDDPFQTLPPSQIPP